MAHIRKLSSGKYRAEIRKQYTFIQAKTFSTQKQAEQWEAEVEELGGIELLQNLGIEVEFVTFKILADEYMKQWICRIVLT